MAEGQANDSLISGTYPAAGQALAVTWLNLTGAGLYEVKASYRVK